MSLQPNNPVLRHHTSFSHQDMATNTIENTRYNPEIIRHERVRTGSTGHGVRERIQPSSYELWEPQTNYVSLAAYLLPQVSEEIKGDDAHVKHLGQWLTSPEQTSILAIIFIVEIGKEDYGEKEQALLSDLCSNLDYGTSI